MRHEFLSGESLSLVGDHRIVDYGWVVAHLRCGETLAIPDVEKSDLIPIADRSMMAAVRIAAHITVPLIKSNNLVGALCVTESSPRTWTQPEVELVKESAERIWVAVVRANAEAALKESDRRKDEFLATLSMSFASFGHHPVRIGGYGVRLG